ncbi:MAG TPA: hypothetical protein VLW85_05090 [Myxococcales bacterium]|nr:hypothetical protein [Myxococcales bacterium]
MFRPHRGSALLAALIVIAVLALVTVATFRLSASSKVQSARDARKLSQTACAETARQYILGRLRVFGLDPTTLTLDQTIPVESGSRRIFTNHARPVAYDSNGIPQPQGAALPAITTVQALPAQLVGNAGAKNRDISNVVVPSPTLGGRSYRVVVTCTDPVAGDLELEFTFKYGL